MSLRRKQNVAVAGWRAVKIGTPPAIEDLYYKTMEMSWPTFVALVGLVFIVVNLAFGATYALLPGSISNMTPGSIPEGFFFSIETLGTVGYGNLAPTSWLGHSIAATEILVGLFFSATMTGLIFARFARPRNCILFSKVAVLGRLDGQPALMVRLASTRVRPLANAQAQMAWLDRAPLVEGQVVRRLRELPLLRSQGAMLGFSWTLIHIPEDDSPFLQALRAGRPLELVVSVSAIDTLLASQSIGGFKYCRDDIRLDHEYVDVISEVDGVVHLDLANFHEAIPIETTNASPKRQVRFSSTQRVSTGA
jgi:inward rectifier potassium channel